MFSVPALCPKRRGLPRPFAQRPLPSMMIATWRGVRSSLSGGGAVLAEVLAPAAGDETILLTSIARFDERTSNGEDLLFLLLADHVRLLHDVVRQLLEISLGALEV